jgi:hypothetical protein
VGHVDPPATADPASGDDEPQTGGVIDYPPAAGESAPPAVIGMDGKSYTPKPKPAPLTDDQQEELDLAAGDKRTAAYVVKVLDLWHVIAGLATNVRRSQIIDCLEPADRARLAEIERSIR